MDYTGFIETLEVSNDCKILLKFAELSILESISFTRKDGQFLRWDGRSGRKSKFDKGEILEFGVAIRTKLSSMSQDIKARENSSSCWIS